MAQTGDSNIPYTYQNKVIGTFDVPYTVVSADFQNRQKNNKSYDVLLCTVRTDGQKKHIGAHAINTENYAQDIQDSQRAMNFLHVLSDYNALNILSRLPVGHPLKRDEHSLQNDLQRSGMFSLPNDGAETHRPDRKTLYFMDKSFIQMGGIKDLQVDQNDDGKINSIDYMHRRFFRTIREEEMGAKVFITTEPQAEKERIAKVWDTYQQVNNDITQGKTPEVKALVFLYENRFDIAQVKPLRNGFNAAKPKGNLRASA